jgi:SEC-C motif-containing protein
MRSRFDAFQSGDAAWLRASCHPAIRPATVDLSDQPTWRRLQIVDIQDGGPEDTEGVVEFRASYVDADGYGVLHERSRFLRVDGKWMYRGGEILD